MSAALQGWRWRSLTPDQAHEVRREYGRGASVHHLAVRYSVHPRTIRRYLLRAAAPVVVIEACGWRAAFEISEDGPVQVEPWRAE